MSKQALKQPKEFKDCPQVGISTGVRVTSAPGWKRSWMQMSIDGGEFAKGKLKGRFSYGLGGTVEISLSQYHYSISVSDMIETLLGHLDEDGAPKTEALLPQFKSKEKS